ncbi:hypothetical protein [Maricaulis sp.]|uniref:hypothetical protein n=1 Tax=Maricaulis sp. TaxID=1486257 RepID=UPI003A93A41E
MILQSEESRFPKRIDRILFIAGLAIYVTGQILINLGPGFTEQQAPIDYAHWLLIIGVLFLIPFAGRLPRRNIHLIGIPLLLAGVCFVIGMCVIDFIFWSIPDAELKRALASHLIATAVIWEPFMVFGPNTIFNLGLLLPSLSYFRASRTGTILVILGTLVIVVGTQWFNVIGYLIVLAGYVLNFDLLKPDVGRPSGQSPS